MNSISNLDWTLSRGEVLNNTKANASLQGRRPLTAVFGSGSVTKESPLYQTALHVGRSLALAGMDVVTGGYGGVMQAVSEGAKQNGARTYGVTVAGSSCSPNPFIDEVETQPTWKDRLFGLIEKADAYVVLDGGIGTLVEFFVVCEMMNRHLMKKPIVLIGAHLAAMVQELRKNPLVEKLPPFDMAQTPEQAVSFLSARSTVA